MATNLRIKDATRISVVCSHPTTPAANDTDLFGFASDKHLCYRHLYKRCVRESNPSFIRDRDISFPIDEHTLCYFYVTITLLWLHVSYISIPWRDSNPYTAERPQVSRDTFYMPSQTNTYGGSPYIRIYGSRRVYDASLTPPLVPSSQIVKKLVLHRSEPKVRVLGVEPSTYCVSDNRAHHLHLTRKFL